LGGAQSDQANDVAVDANGRAYLAGQTASTNFPTKNPIQATYGGGTNDAIFAIVATCDFTLSTPGQALGNGDSGSISITTTPECGWIAASNSTWITLTSSASGVGTGAVSYSVVANTGGPRTGTLTIGGLAVTISQSGIVGAPTLSEAFAVSSLGVGGTTSVSFSLSNPNSGTTLTGVGFTDTLPAGLVVATPNGVSGSCGGGTIMAGSGSIGLTGATLAAGATCMFTVDIQGVSTGLWTNTTGAVSSTQTGSGGTASASLNVSNTGTTSSYSFLTGYALTSLRNDYNGYVGMEFTVGGSALSVSALGRLCVAGNTGTHTVELVNVGTGTAVATANVNMAGCTAGEYQYVALGSAVTLAANTAYYLASLESYGGDQWYQAGPVAANVGTVNAAAYFDWTNWHSGSGANTSYVPPNFVYNP
jgi:hypothetical protein